MAFCAFLLQYEEDFFLNLNKMLKGNNIGCKEKDKWEKKTGDKKRKIKRGRRHSEQQQGLQRERVSRNKTEQQQGI